MMKKYVFRIAFTIALFFALLVVPATNTFAVDDQPQEHIDWAGTGADQQRAPGVVNLIAEFINKDILQITFLKPVGNTVVNITSESGKKISQIFTVNAPTVATMQLGVIYAGQKCDIEIISPTYNIYLKGSFIKR